MSQTSTFISIIIFKPRIICTALRVMEVRKAFMYLSMCKIRLQYDIYFWKTSSSLQVNSSNKIHLDGQCSDTRALVDTSWSNRLLNVYGRRLLHRGLMPISQVQKHWKELLWKIISIMKDFSIGSNHNWCSGALLTPLSPPPWLCQGWQR